MTNFLRQEIRRLQGPLLQVAAAALWEKLSVASYYVGSTNVSQLAKQAFFLYLYVMILVRAFRLVCTTDRQVSSCRR